MTIDDRAEVAVIGAGPAGAAAAITLARAGRSVVVVDKARFPRDKCCGDGLTAAALRRLESLGLQPDQVASWQYVGNISARSPSGRYARMQLPARRGTYAAIARRRDLDAVLVGLARRAGADVREQAGLVAAHFGPDWDVELANGATLRARYLIGADGAWSPLRRMLGQADESGYRGEWHAFRQYFEVDDSAARDLWIWMEPDLLPGYAWSFPLPGGKANVGMAILRRPGQPAGFMGRRWEEVIKRPHIASVLGAGHRAESRHLAWPIPTRVGTSSLSARGGRALFVGDAARAGDSMTGEGIDQALHTGILAAEAIIRAKKTGGPGVGSTYTRSVRAHMIADHRLSRAISATLSRPLMVDGAIALAGSSSKLGALAARWLFEDEPRAVLATPRRWHRDLFDRPGAFYEAGEIGITSGS
ncbi:MAG: NAD(P)/FAD-dependent oxidoreductase [Acidimicrobiales bacterium]